jgi:hypothetical protein
MTKRDISSYVLLLTNLKKQIASSDEIHPEDKELFLNWIDELLIKLRNPRRKKSKRNIFISIFESKYIGNVLVVLDLVLKIIIAVTSK